MIVRKKNQSKEEKFPTQSFFCLIASHLLNGLSAIKPSNKAQARLFLISFANKEEKARKQG